MYIITAINTLTYARRIGPCAKAGKIFSFLSIVKNCCEMFSFDQNLPTNLPFSR